MKCVVTGGAGFIGSHLAEALVKNGEEAVIVDNLCSGNRDNLAGFREKVKFLKGDVRDLGFLKKAFRGVDVVLHHAALISVVESVDKPGLYHEVNVEGTKNVLEAARHNNVGRVVFSSSCAVYGETDDLPMREGQDVRPASPYAEDKLEAEKLCKEYYEKHGLKTMVLRYFNVFGPRQSPDSSYAGVIPLFVKKVLNNETPVIYGDGEQTRDFVYVRDVVRANLLALGAVRGFGEPVNIASGNEISVNQVLEAVNKVTGGKAVPKHAPERRGELRRVWADVDKADKQLGFKSRYDFEKGLAETVDWLKKKS